MKKKFNRGQAMVETAITIPLFFMVFLASIQFGYVMYQKHALYNAVNKGVRMAVTSGSQNPETQVKNHIMDILRTVYGLNVSADSIHVNLSNTPITIRVTSSKDILGGIFSVTAQANTCRQHTGILKPGDAC